MSLFDKLLGNLSNFDKLRVRFLSDGSLLILCETKRKHVYKIIREGICLHLYEFNPANSRADREGFIQTITFNRTVASTILDFLAKKSFLGKPIVNG